MEAYYVMEDEMILMKSYSRQNRIDRKLAEKEHLAEIANESPAVVVKPSGAIIRKGKTPGTRYNRRFETRQYRHSWTAMLREI